MVRITCGIPIFNQRNSYFIECLQSVINQTLSDDLYEIIILDDGSEPSVGIILPDSKGIDIKLISHKKNLGIGAARQAIVDNASKKSEFICFLSSDDIWDKDFLKIMLEQAKQYPGKVLYCGSYTIDSDGKILKVVSPPGFEHKDFCIASWEYAERNQMFVNFSTTFFPREVFEKIQFDKSLRYCEDLDFLLRSMKHFEYQSVQEHLLKYRVTGNLTSRILDKIPKQNQGIRKKCWEYWGIKDE